MLNTARGSTRLIARSTFSLLFINRGKGGHGGRACRLALSGRIGSSLGIPSIQLSMTLGIIYPLTLYSTLFSRLDEKNLKIFFQLLENSVFSAIESHSWNLHRLCKLALCHGFVF